MADTPYSDIDPMNWNSKHVGKFLNAKQEVDDDDIDP